MLYFFMYYLVSHDIISTVLTDLIHTTQTTSVLNLLLIKCKMAGNFVLSTSPQMKKNEEKNERKNELENTHTHNLLPVPVT